MIRRVLCLIAAVYAFAGPSPADNRQFNGCVLAMDPSVGRWLIRDDPRGRADVHYPPGSTIKPFTVMAAYEGGSRTDNVIRCEPSDPSEPVRDACWYRPGHGTVDMEKAIAVSCDRYFMKLAESTDWRRFLDVAARFGLIDREAMAALKDIPAEERFDVMVGLSAKLKVSPSALLRAYGALFNGGYLFKDTGGGRLTIDRRVKADNRAIKILVSGLAGATLHGTAWEIGKAFPDRAILSKTGTAIYSMNGITDRNKTHGWYVGLSPVANPRAAVVVFVPEGTGAHEAVPVAIGYWPKVFKSGHL